LYFTKARAARNYAFNNLVFVVNSIYLPFLEKRVLGCFFGLGPELAFHSLVFGKFQYIKSKKAINSALLCPVFKTKLKKGKPN